MTYYVSSGTLNLTKPKPKPKYDTVTSATSVKIAKHQLRNKAVEVVENAIGYKCETSPDTNNLNVVQIPKIYIAVKCIFNIFITVFMQIMNLLTSPV